MVQPHANAATSAEPAARIEFASRRQPRGASSASDDGFAAILDRSNAQRVDALRHLRQVEEPTGEDAPAQSAEIAVDPAARARKPAAPEQTTQQAKPQRRPARSGNDGAEGESPATPTSTPEMKTEAPHDATRTHEAKPAPVADTTTGQAPVDSQSTTVVAVVAQLMAVPPAPIQGAAPTAPNEIGGPTPPAFITPPAAPPAPDAAPAVPVAPTTPMGPEAPAEPMTQASPAQASSMAAAATPPSPQSTTAASTPVSPETPLSQATPATSVPPPEQPAIAPPSAAAAKPKSEAQAPQAVPASSSAAPAPAVAPAPVAPTPAQSAPMRPEAAPAAVMAATALVEASQPQRTAETKPALAFAPGDGSVDDATIELPVPALGTPPAVTNDPGAAARAAPTRSANGTNNAVAAQLAQNDDGGIPPAALPATPAVAPPPLDAGQPGDENPEMKAAARQDELAPVRHAIVVPPETGAARIENTTEAVAARAARMPMHPAVAQVAVSVTKAVQDGVDRITIKLQPPELGRIDVRLEVGVDGRIQAVFAAERPATVEILQRDVRELERALQSAGLSTDAGSLSFGLKQNGGQNGNAFAAFERKLGTGPAAAGEDDTALATTRSKRAAADGRLDIHV